MDLLNQHPTRPRIGSRENRHRAARRRDARHPGDRSAARTAGRPREAVRPPDRGSISIARAHRRCRRCWLPGSGVALI